MRILDALTKSQKEKGTKIGLLTTAATTGVTVAKFFGKRSIYGIIGGVAVTLAADYIRKKYEKKIETEKKESVLEQ
ncbi:hypothetical protein HX001_00720 [Empedobacter brevis]|uniref:Uncharacterized protein n=1 Tax=Empedobacter brevis TaxID=247 RepID=A0AAJ1QBH4_9FLAO|nr:hypothetical protein [Empedobacter brevis]MDM1071009.1 hypothetical protein [Empedobacter brevis]